VSRTVQRPTLPTTISEPFAACLGPAPHGFDSVSYAPYRGRAFVKTSMVSVAVTLSGSGFVPAPRMTEVTIHNRYREQIEGWASTADSGGSADRRLDSSVMTGGRPPDEGMAGRQRRRRPPGPGAGLLRPI